LWAVAALGALAIAGCATAPTGPTLPTKGAVRKGPDQNAGLPYEYEIDGFDVEISTAQLTETAVAWDQTVDEAIGEDERWLSVDVAVTEMLGRERLFPWVLMVRMKTALDEIVSAPHVLSARDEAVGTTEEKLSPNEREEMRFFFRVRRGDFPVTLIFADGGAAPLGQ